ncbi:TetR/AcrR family transcriptional regulator [Mycobacterium sp. M1]|uniref:TetR/AcrR family transcriptional regulator n=1 Tax=Mycolicibacter acidiphilus TaxID=2835306 RepID=A0ABS5RMS9_9MYCO|nr:TetR/AcrR family transcriptional regulator [Mycolicibacter acidiphilus]MBS9534786.1 TetR/AcrR family transcriptional regulator [Mycolicibacter acidiphilus]
MSAPAKSRASHLGPERRRPMVLDAALDIAVRDGVNAVTIGAVADRLGVTRPVVYACFADRVELIEALLEREHIQLVADVLAALHSTGGDDPQAAFTDGYRALLSAVGERPASWQLIFAAAPDAAVADRFQRSRSGLAAESARWIRPALARWWDTADLDRKLPVLIELFVSSCEAAVRSLLDPQVDWTADQLAELYGRVIAEALRVA